MTNNSVITPHDERNSTTAVLGSGATYTGDWVQLGPDINIKIAAFADADGTVYTDFSNDPNVGQTFVDPSLGYQCPASVFESIKFTPIASYFRVRYVNGSTAQTSFELYTSYSKSSLQKLDPLNKQLALDENALPVRSVDPQDDILRGLRAGVSTINKFSFRDDIDTTDGDALIIPDNTTNTPTILETATTFDIAYTNTTDGLGQNGALSLLFTYLDENEEQQDAVHVLGSSGSETTSFSGLGINRCVVLSSGSANTNTNDITITATTGSSVQACLPALTGVTQQLWAHIPINTVPIIKFIQLNAYKIGGGGSPKVKFKLFVYNRFTQTRYEILRKKMDTDVQNEIVIDDRVNIPLSARDVFWVTCSTDANNTEASARISLNIYDII